MSRFSASRIFNGYALSHRTASNKALYPSIEQSIDPESVSLASPINYASKPSPPVSPTMENEVGDGTNLVTDVAKSMLTAMRIADTKYTLRKVRLPSRWRYDGLCKIGRSSARNLGVFFSFAMRFSLGRISMSDLEKPLSYVDTEVN